MKVSDVKDLAMLAAMGVGVYFLYKFVNKLPSGADVNRAASEAKNLLTTSAPRPLGQVRLTNGQVISVNDIVKAGGIIDTTGGFTWQGIRYTILSLGPDGVYEVM